MKGRKIRDLYSRAFVAVPVSRVGSDPEGWHTSRPRYASVGERAQSVALRYPPRSHLKQVPGQNSRWQTLRTRPASATLPVTPNPFESGVIPTAKFRVSGLHTEHTRNRTYSWDANSRGLAPAASVRQLRPFLARTMRGPRTYA
jgi:hypothetical protein